MFPWQLAEKNGYFFIFYLTRIIHLISQITINNFTIKNLNKTLSEAKKIMKKILK